MKFLAAFLLVIILIVCVIALISTIEKALKGKKRNLYVWDNPQLPDGTTVVQIKRAGEHPRIIKELPVGMDSIEFAVELEAAQDEAERQVRALNKRKRR